MPPSGGMDGLPSGPACSFKKGYCPVLDRLHKGVCTMLADPSIPSGRTATQERVPTARGSTGWTIRWSTCWPDVRTGAPIATRHDRCAHAFLSAVLLTATLISSNLLGPELNDATMSNQVARGLVMVPAVVLGWGGSSGSMKAAPGAAAWPLAGVVAAGGRAVGGFADPTAGCLGSGAQDMNRMVDMRIRIRIHCGAALPFAATTGLGP